MTSLESYAHKAAKATLVEWLETACRQAKHCDWVYPCGLRFRPNGIWEEYPIVSWQTDGLPLWCETNWWDDWKERFGDWPHGSEPCEHYGDEVESRWCYRPPTRDEVLKLGERLLSILDVVVSHKGVIKYAFEIVHKNPVSRSKAERMKKFAFPVYEVPAEWILAQVRVPDRLVVSRMFGDKLNYHDADIEWWRRR